MICREVGGYRSLQNNPRGVDMILDQVRLRFGMENCYAGLRFEVFLHYENQCDEDDCVKYFWPFGQDIDIDDKEKILYTLLKEKEKLTWNQIRLFGVVFDKDQEYFYENVERIMTLLF